LRGRVTDHHRFLLQLHLQHIDALDTDITAECLGRFRHRYLCAGAA